MPICYSHSIQLPTGHKLIHPYKMSETPTTHIHIILLLLSNWQATKGQCCHMAQPIMLPVAIWLHVFYYSNNNFMPQFMLNVYGHYDLCCFMCKIPKFYFNGRCLAWFIAKSIWPLSATWNVHGGSHFEIVPWRKDGSILKYFWCWCVDKWQQCSSKEQNKLSVQRNGIGSMNFVSVAIWQQSTKRIKR